MKKLLVLMAMVTFVCSGFHLKSMINPRAEWTVVVYMAGDNNLASYMQSDINEMIVGLSKAASFVDDRVNILVQLDLPSDDKTWRFRIESSGKIEDESVNQEMGVDPERELVSTAEWVKKYYSANHYFWILSGHGSGSEDYKGILTESDKKRGILYDDSQDTCLTNRGLTNAFTKIKNILKPGARLEILGMDACLMGMLEVVYQIKDCFEYFVGSQQVEPGSGWDYVGLIGVLADGADKIPAIDLAKIAVDSYGAYYSPGKNQTFTLAAYDLNEVDIIKANLDLFVYLVEKCAKYKSSTIKKAVIAARLRTVCFDNINYIDLYSFMRELHKEVMHLIDVALNHSPICILKKYPHKYVVALQELAANIQVSIQLISSQLVIRNTFGRCFINGDDVNANGVSIYYPSPKNSVLSIHRSYYDTRFANDSSWTNFIKKYRNV